MFERCSLHVIAYLPFCLAGSGEHLPHSIVCASDRSLNVRMSCEAMLYPLPVCTQGLGSMHYVMESNVFPALSLRNRTRVHALCPEKQRLPRS